MYAMVRRWMLGGSRLTELPDGTVISPQSTTTDRWVARELRKPRREVNAESKMACPEFTVSAPNVPKMFSFLLDQSENRSQEGV
jgi:hypothetical protein